MTTYFKVDYDNQAGGEYVADAEGFTELTWTGGGRGQIARDIPGSPATTGNLRVALIAGALPSDNDVLTQGAVTADANGDATTLLYPAYFREDVSITDSGSDKDVRWVGPAADGSGIIPTHSCKLDGQTTNLTLQDTLTFSGGQTAELIRINGDVGPTLEIEVRMISNLDAGLPVDGDTLTDEGSGDGTLQGEMHPRSYIALDLHRLLADLNTDPQFVGNDDLSALDPTPSVKDTDQIVRLIGGANIDDTMVLHMYGGSIAQTSGASGDVKYSGLDVQVTSPLSTTRPILIQYDRTTGLPAIITDKWSDAWNPDSIAGNVRVMVKIRENGVDIDGRRIRGKLLEFGESYFEGGTTLGDATTGLSLFSAGDGNNNTAVGTVAGAPYNTVDFTEGFQDLDYSNGNGLTPFGLSMDYDAATSPQAYEWTKYVQRRGTSETLFGLNGQLVRGIDRNFPHDAETAALVENQLMGWGTIVAYDNQSGTFVQGESLSFSGGAVGRLLLIDDDTPTGTMIVDVIDGVAIGDDEVITGGDSSATADVNDAGGVDIIEGRSGTGWLIAYDDQGATGNTYYQGMSGLDPVDNQPIYQLITETLESVDVNGIVATRTINNQFIGVYTGTTYATNFGIGIDISDAILGDLNLNLLNAQQGVPNNQLGVITTLLEFDRVWVYLWDGSTVDANGDAIPEFDQFSLQTTLSGGAETAVQISVTIPTSTPSSGQIRVTTDGGVRRLISYTSYATDTFTIPSTDFSSDNATAANGVAVAYLDQDVPSATTQLSFTGIYTSDLQMVARVIRGDNDPIVPSKANPVWGSTGFNIAAGRLDDS